MSQQTVSSSTGAESICLCHLCVVSDTYQLKSKARLKRKECGSFPLQCWRFLKGFRCSHSVHLHKIVLLWKMPFLVGKFLASCHFLFVSCHFLLASCHFLLASRHCLFAGTGVSGPRKLNYTESPQKTRASKGNCSCLRHPCHCHTRAVGDPVRKTTSDF